MQLLAYSSGRTVTLHLTAIVSQTASRLISLSALRPFIPSLSAPSEPKGNHSLRLFAILSELCGKYYFVGVDGFEPPIHADYVIYSHAPNQLEHYSHFYRLSDTSRMSHEFHIALVTITSANYRYQTDFGRGDRFELPASKKHILRMLGLPTSLPSSCFRTD